MHKQTSLRLSDRYSRPIAERELEKKRSNDKKKILFPHRESNPGRGGESAES